MSADPIEYFTKCKVDEPMREAILNGTISPFEIWEYPEFMGISLDELYSKDMARSIRASARMQEAEQIAEFHAGINSTNNSFMLHFWNFYFPLRDLPIQNSRPAILGSFTNLTSIAYIKLMSMFSDNNPLIIDPYTYPNTSDFVREQAQVIGGNGRTLPLADSTLSSICSDMLFTFINKVEPGRHQNIGREIARTLTDGGRAVFLKIANGAKIAKQELTTAGLKIIDEDSNGNPFQVYTYDKFQYAAIALNNLVISGSCQPWLKDDLYNNRFEDTPPFEIIVAQKN